MGIQVYMFGADRAGRKDRGSQRPLARLKQYLRTRACSLFRSIPRKQNRAAGSARVPSRGRPQQLNRDVVKRRVAGVGHGMSESALGKTDFAILQCHGDWILANAQVDDLRISERNKDVVVVMAMDQSSRLGSGQHIENPHPVVL